MKKKVKKSKNISLKSGDAPAWTEKQLTRAELAENGKVIRAASGTLTKRGRPKKAETKELIRIRLSPQVIRHFRADGPGWQTRIDEALRHLIT